MPLKRGPSSELPGHLVELRDHHSARASPLLDDLKKEWVEARREAAGNPYGIDPLTLPTGKALKEQPEDVLVSVFVTALISGKRFTGAPVVSWLERKRLPFAPNDVELVLRDALFHERDWWYLSKLAPAVSAAASVPKAAHSKPIRPLLEAAVKATEDEGIDPQVRARVRARLHELLAKPGKIDLALIDKGDEWGNKMRRRVKQFSGEPGVAELLLHLTKATSSRPSDRWRKECAARLGAAPSGDELVRALLEGVLGTDVVVRERFYSDDEFYYDYVFLTDPNSTLARGAIWSLLELDHPWRLDLIERLLAVTLRNTYKLANACIYVLGELGDDESLVLLSRVRSSVSDKNVLRQVEKALGSAAEQAGLTKWQLRERLVPVVEARKEVAFDDSAALLAVEQPGRVSLTWETSGKTSRTVPAAVKERHASELAALKSEAKELKEAVGAERRRLEELFVDDASWPFDEWCRRYLDCEPTKSIATRLIWSFENGKSKAGLPLEPGQIVDARGKPFEPAEKAVVRLWHPIEKPVGEVAAWRSYLLEHEFQQPFKQAFREVYPIAPAERRTRVYSNRFAAHILRYPQTYALMRSRQWSVVALGPYDNDGGRNWRDFESAGIRVELWLDDVEADDDVYATLSALASSDQVRFYHLGEHEPMPLADVPPLVFSEAMRDVDLFVGVSSIAGDPEWRDHGDQRFHDYWYRTSFGDLTETAETRREVLEALLPRLKIGDRCRIDGKFLVVEGDLRTYKIHLGSGNILMEPNDEYLCIVSARRSTKKVFLPFEEDSVLSVIVSKAFLLAADKRIKDETITAQIQGRRSQS